MKARHITLSEAAIADFLEQADWYETRSDHTLAERWEKAVTSTLLRIYRQPNSGSLCFLKPVELSGARHLPVAGFSKHLIFYRSEGDEIIILRIVHGARDLESLFSG